MKGDGIDLELTANGARKEEQENKALEWSETPLATVFPPTSPPPSSPFLPHTILLSKIEQKRC